MCAVATLVGVGIACTAGWFLWKEIDPLHGPEWAFTVLLFGVVCTLAAVFFSAVVAAREPDERNAAFLAIIANTAAALTLIASVAAR